MQFKTHEEIIAGCWGAAGPASDRCVQQRPDCAPAPDIKTNVKLYS